MDVVAVATIVAAGIGGLASFAGAVLLFIQVRANRRDDTADRREDRLSAEARELIQAALTERGIERRVETLDERLNQHTDGQRDLERQLGALREQLPEKYVSRADWVEATARQERKTDAIYAKLEELSTLLHERTGHLKG